MTKKWLVDALAEFPDESEIIVEVYNEKDDVIHCAEPTGVWARATGQIIISNED